MQPITTSPLVRKYTLKEFWALPEPKDGSKLELIAGVLYMTPPPDSLHHFSVSKLIRLFSGYLAKARDRGEIFVPRAALWTSPATCVEPDLFYLTVKTLKETDWDHPTRADLVVEVISPSSAIYDRNTKADTYAALGVKELWLIDPVNGTIEVRKLDEASNQYHAGVVFKRGQRVRSELLPKFTPSVAEIFKR
jgi:Uma2 family endonuclease